MVGFIFYLLINKYHSSFIFKIETYTDHPIWWHYLCISVPHKLTRPNTAFLLIDGGSNRDQ
jgi:hypothetical protein